MWKAYKYLIRIQTMSSDRHHGTIGKIRDSDTAIFSKSESTCSNSLRELTGGNSIILSS